MYYGEEFGKHLRKRMANKILLKYILKYSDSMTPYYNKDGLLVGVGFKSVTRGKMFALKYFEEKAKEWLLQKFQKETK